MNKTSLVQKDKAANALSPSQGMLQRKCVCGNHTPAGSNENRNSLQRSAVSNQPMNEVSPFVPRMQQSDSERTRVDKNNEKHDFPPVYASLTTEIYDEGMFQTTIGDTVPTNSFDTEVSESVGATPEAIVGSSLAASHSCVPTIVRSSLPSGHLVARVSGGRFIAPFSMQADFNTPVPCNGICGEYRQFVSGFSQVNGTDIVHPLCSNNMSRTTGHEDCSSSGGTILMYGYHSIPFGTSQFTNPDQATGWSYRGYDAPGFNLAAFPSGTVLNWKLSFRGELVDACDGDKSLQPSATWTAGGLHTVV